MTPAITLLEKHQSQYRLHEYAHDPMAESFGLEAAEKLGVSSNRIFKTLVVSLNSGELAVGIVPVEKMLSTKLLAKILGAKKAKMADKQMVSKITGYVLGGVSPLGQKTPLATVIDQSADQSQTIFVSGGQRGLDIELLAQDLAKLCNAQFAPIAQE